MALKGLLSILALILIVAGFAVIVLGYSPNTPPTDTGNDTIPEEPASPEYPEEQEHVPWYPPNVPHTPQPISLFNIPITDTEFIGILLIVAGFILLAIGGKQ